MKKGFSAKRVLCLLLTAVLLMSGLAMAGCSKKEEVASSTTDVTATSAPTKEESNNETATEQAAETATETDSNGYGFTEGITLDSEGSVNIFAFAEGQNYEKVIQKFEDITKDTLKTDLSFQWASDIKTEQPLQLASQGDIDLIFDAAWLNSATNISQGMYQDISKYFNNPEYPGLQKAFPADVVESMKNSNDGNIYGVPFFNTYNSVKSIFIRGDWREKLGCAPVVDEETFLAYLKAVDENKVELGAVAAMGLGDREFFYFLNDTYGLQNQNIFEIASTGARITQYAYVLLNDAKNQVTDVHYIGDPDSEFANWPITHNFLNKKTIEFGNTWGKYVNEDCLSVSGTDVKEKFKTGLYGAIEIELGGYLDILRDLQKTDANAKLEYYIYEDQLKNMDKGSVYLDAAVSNNLLYVPYFNEEPDRAMAVLDWVFQCQANNDLFNYGIEGEDFERIGDNQYKTIVSDKQYVFPTWLFSNNAMYIRYDADVPQDVLVYYLWGADASNFIKNPFAGFNFTTADISTEYTAFTTIQQDYYKQFMSGSFGADTEARLNEFYELTKDYSVVLREEVKKQMNNYFANKK